MTKVSVRKKNGMVKRKKEEDTAVIGDGSDAFDPSGRHLYRRPGRAD